MKKLSLVLVVLMIGLVGANNSLYNVVGIDIPSNVIAGNEFVANFSFDYLDDHSNPESSPLIIQLNFSCNDSEYPVWRNDFVVSGHIKKSALWGFIPLPSVYFKCNNSENQVIEHPLDAQEVWADNGTFYCYNAEGDLELEERDKVYLDIISHQAIYPGTYNLTASMFYLTDGRAPFVNITNKDLFERYYRENDNVLVEATISDASGIAGRWASAVIDASDGSETFFLVPQDILGGIYPFSQNTPVDIVEGYYELFVFAEDEFGNVGNDNVTLKIDRTAPNISLIEWEDEVITGMMSIVANVTDEKAGVDNSSVEYRLREMNGTNICPEDGVGTWICYNSGWLPLNWTSGDLFEVEVNTTKLGLNGEYWLQIRASDILGNEGVLGSEEELEGEGVPGE